jgi:hypothetical protein
MEMALAMDGEDALPFDELASETASLSSYMTCYEGHTVEPTYNNGASHPQDDDNTTTDDSYTSCVIGVIEAPRCPSTPIITVRRPEPEATFLLLSPTERQEPGSAGDAGPPGAD